jgi:hypothetical protein
MLLKLQGLRSYAFLPGGSYHAFPELIDITTYFDTTGVDAAKQLSYFEEFKVVMAMGVFPLPDDPKVLFTPLPILFCQQLDLAEFEKPRGGGKAMLRGPLFRALFARVNDVDVPFLKDGRWSVIPSEKKRLRMYLLKRFLVAREDLNVASWARRATRKRRAARKRRATRRRR